jgi:putative transposase
LAGCPWHVIQRGVNRSLCFADDADRQRYLALLKEHAAANGCHLHAYVLMGNHVHLLISSRSEEGISNAMKAVGERYVRYFNRKHGRTGTLWEGRFRSSVVDSERYFLTCQLYIELNPVRARIVRHPREYPWSSYLSNASGSPSGLLTPHELYLRLGTEPPDRGLAYQALFDTPPEEKRLELIRESVNGGFALADPPFVERVQATTSLPVVRRKPGRKRGPMKQNGAECSAPREMVVCPLFE